MIPSKSFQDEIPDSMFRELFKKNALSLFFLTIISISFSIFFYFKIMDKNYISIYYVNLKNSNQITHNQSIHHQKFIRLLKSDKIRSQVIESNNLISHYKINPNNKLYKIQLDKYLFDKLKVEEQSDGSIMVRYKNIDSVLNKKVITDLLDFAIIELNTTTKNQEINIISKTTYEDANKWCPKLIVLSSLVTGPVLLLFVILIAIKEKLLLTLKTNQD